MFDHIEKLKREYTDKYVAVDAGRPELNRFKDLVGLVKTVNMSGRALVEFDDYHLNIGWYDIDVDFLKVVPKPEAGEKKAAKKPSKPAAKPKAAAAPTEKKLSPLEMARMQDAAKKGGDKAASPSAKESPTKEASSAPKKPAAKPAGGKMDTADILAAARANKAAPEQDSASAPSDKAKPAGGKMSTADILAAARGDKGESAPAAEKPAAKPAKPAAKPAASEDDGGSVDLSDLTEAERIVIAKAQEGTNQYLKQAPQEDDTPAFDFKKPAKVEERRTEETVTPAVTEGEVVATEEPPPTPAEEPAEEPAAAAPAGAVDKSSMSIDDMIAWCQEHDAS